MTDCFSIERMELDVIAIKSHLSEIQSIRTVPRVNGNQYEATFYQLERDYHKLYNILKKYEACIKFYNNHITIAEFLYLLPSGADKYQLEYIYYYPNDYPRRI
jgi:hypothetical protein